MTGPANDPNTTPDRGPQEGPDRSPQEGPGPPANGPEGPPRHRQPRGSEPVTARSPLRLRAVMSAVALVAGVVAAVLFALVANRDGSTGFWVATAICAVLALIALTDLAVITRRFRT
jgi:hypothetical protein